MGSTKYCCFPRWADRRKIVYYLSCLVEVNDKQTHSLEALAKIAQKKREIAKRWPSFAFLAGNDANLVPSACLQRNTVSWERRTFCVGGSEPIELGEKIPQNIKFPLLSSLVRVNRVSDAHGFEFF